MRSGVIHALVILAAGTTVVSAQEQPEAIRALMAVVNEGAAPSRAPRVLSALREDARGIRHDSATLAALLPLFVRIAEGDVERIVDTTIVTISRAGQPIGGEYLITLTVGSARKCPRSGIAGSSVRTVYKVRCEGGRCVPVVHNRTSGSGACR
jgi:hypothetical protein